MMVKYALIALALAGTSAPALAAVDLTGASVTATLFFPDLSTAYAGPVSTTVGAQVEFPQGSFSPAFGSFDITSNQITFFTNQNATYSSGTFNGYRLDFANYTGSLGSLALAAGSTFAPNDFYVSGNSVFINVAGQSVQAGDFATLTAGVPEPTTWAMMIVGVGLVGGAMRRRAAVRTTVRFA